VTVCKQIRGDGPEWDKIPQCSAGAPFDGHDTGALPLASAVSTVSNPSLSLDQHNQLWDFFDEFDAWLVSEREKVETYTV
jgi:hypothetical protein